MLTAGTFYQQGGVVFYDVHDPDGTIVLELEHERYNRLIVEVEAPRSHALPWVILGTSAAVLTTGVIVGLENRAAVHDGEAATDPMRVMELQDRVLSTGLAANILYAVAAAGAAVGILILVLD